MDLSLSLVSCSFSLSLLSTSLALLRTIANFNCSNCWPLGFSMGSLRNLPSPLLIAMASYLGWVSNLTIDCEWESTICVLDLIPWMLESTFCTIEVKVPRPKFA